MSAEIGVEASARVDKSAASDAARASAAPVSEEFHELEAGSDFYLFSGPDFPQHDSSDDDSSDDDSSDHDSSDDDDDDDTLVAEGSQDSAPASPKLAPLTHKHTNRRTAFTSGLLSYFQRSPEAQKHAGQAPVSRPSVGSNDAAPSHSQRGPEDFVKLDSAHTFPQSDGGDERALDLELARQLSEVRKFHNTYGLGSELRDKAFAEVGAMNPSDDFASSAWPQAGPNADAQHLAGPGKEGRLDVTIDSPRKEGEGSKDAYISYLVTTHSDFSSFQQSDFSVRRRYSDFVFLYNTLCKEYPQCAVPPLPDKHNLSYARGQGFNESFIQRRAHSLHRFIKRLTLHPVLRRAMLLLLFLESSDWNMTMKSRPSRSLSSEQSSGGVLETFTDSLLNAFSKAHKPDKRFMEVRERADKLDEDLGHVEKIVAKVARREGDLEADYADLAAQFQKLATLEPGVEAAVTAFAASVNTTAHGFKELREYTDQNYLGSLKDMEAYVGATKSLLKTREQKQEDFEALTTYLQRSVADRDALASAGAHPSSLTGSIRAKLEDVRGVDHEQSRRDRVRILELTIARLQGEVEGAKKTSEAFDEEVVREVADFERIKAVEFRDCLGGLARANCAFWSGNVETWERFVADMENEEAQAK
ncbi:intercellular trafficking and secretion [Oleoguttula sp. CCFEE 6159]|nr:intercellular trafficking and secretion [Oleoguttula sp. CCFEE 6159]